MDRRHWILGAQAVAGLGACGGGDGAPPVLAVGGDGSTRIDNGALAAVLATYPLAPLSSAERESLLFMREEEHRPTRPTGWVAWPALHARGRAAGA